MEGNYIGPNISGTQLLGNSTGVLIDSASSDITVGGTNGGDGAGGFKLTAGNVISGNTTGVDIAGGDSENTAVEGIDVEGNLIGTDASGHQAQNSAGTV